MTIKPYGSKLLLKVDAPEAGGLDLSSRPTVIESGTILAVGDNVEYFEHDFKPGERVLFKAWALDTLTLDGETHYFLDVTSGGLCGFVTA